MRRSQLFGLILVLILGVGTLTYFIVIERISWGQILKISSDSTIGAQYPTINADDNTIYCAWEAFDGENSDIYLITFNSTSWSPIQKISEDYRNESQQSVSIDVQNGEIYGVWASNRDEVFGDIDIYYRHFDGTVWGAETLISEDNFTEWQGNPVITVDNKSIHLAWVRAENPWEVQGDEDVQYKYFDGVLWHPEQAIGTDITASISNRSRNPIFGYWENKPQGWPAIAAENGKIHIVWVERYENDADIFYIQYNGVTWLPKIELSQDITHEIQLDPAIAVSRGKVHVVWADKKRGDYDIVYRSYDGVNWGNEKEISHDTVAELQQRPSITAIGNKIYVVWEDYRDGDSDIYGRYFDGKFWHLVQKISFDTREESQTHPAVAATIEAFHIVWMEDSSGIYYRSFGLLSWEAFRVGFSIIAIWGTVCVIIFYVREKKQPWNPS